MKNFIKKLGVFGIIIAMLIPFVELPVVNAAEDEECSVHLQTYLFIDVATGNRYATGGGFGHYWKDGEGYTTYALSPNTFLNVDSEVTILDYSINYVNGKNAVNKFKQAYNVLEASDNEYAGDKDLSGAKVFVSGTTKDYADNTYIGHAKWARYDENGDTIESEWDPINTFYTFQTSAGFTFDKDNVKIEPAKYNGSFSNNSVDMKTYLQNIANDETETQIAFKITRYIDEDEVKSKVFGSYKDGELFAYSSKTGTSKADIENSYQTWVSTGDSDSLTVTGISEDDVDFVMTENNSTEYRRYYWPAVLTVEYQTCSEKTVNPESKWVLKYNGNTTDNSAKGLPDNSAETAMGTDIAISDTVPTRDGYTFQGWCIDEKECSNPLKAKASVKSPDTGTVRVAYAQWGKTGTETNNKTGVVSYIIGFISVGLIAAGIYFVAKKKNLFKQI